VGELGAGLGELVHEGFWEEARSFGDAEFDGSSRGVVKTCEEVFVFGCGEVRVKLVAIGLQHGS